MQMHHEEDPKDKILKELGDISDVEIFNNQVLLAVYIRPEKTKSGIYLSDKVKDEDRFQGKVGLLVKRGPAAFVDDGEWFSGMDFSEAKDWLIYRPSEGWQITVNGVLCRIFQDVDIKGRISHPDRVF
jgi:co-chaperonin GroES (HSP10)